MEYFFLKFLHVLGAITLLGTGIGIAFFMLMAHFSRDAEFIHRTAKTVVLADFLFTATAVIAQPVTGYLLMRHANLSFQEGWIATSLLLYGAAGVFWLPVIRIQMRLRDIAGAATSSGEPLPTEYFRQFRIWFIFGFPGFGSVIAILWLMNARPDFRVL